MGKAVEIEPGIVVEMRNGKPVKSRLRNRQWSVAKKAIFLDHLAETCNVEMSVEAAGGAKSTVYRIRRRDPEFADAWQVALESGYATLETMLLGGLLKPVPLPIGETSQAELSDIDRDHALKLLSHHKRAVKGNIKVGHPKIRRATEEEACEAILQKLDLLQARIDAGEA